MVCLEQPELAFLKGKAEMEENGDNFREIKLSKYHINLFFFRFYGLLKSFSLYLDVTLLGYYVNRMWMLFTDC